MRSSRNRTVAKSCYTQSLLPSLGYSLICSSHFVIYKIRRVRNAMAFSDVGIAFPAPRRVTFLSVIYFFFWFLSRFVCFILQGLSWLAAGFFSIACRLTVFCFDSRSSSSISRFHREYEWLLEQQRR